MTVLTPRLTERLARLVHPLPHVRTDYEPLLDLVGNARLVLLGEATHGTSDFYRARADVTKRLILEKGFTAVAVEADWPDAYRVNRYVLGRSHDRDSAQALSDFERFPTWMWRNRDVKEFVDWLKKANDASAARSAKVGFYGLDLYSLHTSIEAVLRYLDGVDPEAARRARSRYGCFDHFGEDTQSYGYAAAFGMSPTCEDAVVSELRDLQRRAETYLRRDGFVAEDEFFFAEQNARLVKNAEHYYRSMFQGRISSWNLRDRHMAETLDALLIHLSRHQPNPRIVVWEHNSHLGDARATEMGKAGELNVGQLARERYGRDVLLIGFTTYQGTVTAASRWDGPAERKVVRPALPDSYEALFHQTGIGRFLVDLTEPTIAELLKEPRLERAIGVIYLPESERISHYFHARLPEQFDAVFHFDDTKAVEPIGRTAASITEDAPETFPSGV
ncbi:MAG TPA: erythromycin esterase family protein [Nitrospiraceae bacterium]|nr:erythromycin esterase family protein [Nitrospiraceae bacterium]